MTALGYNLGGKGKKEVEEKLRNDCDSRMTMQKELYEKVGAVSVDLGYMGFSVTTERPFADPGQSGCSSCGGSCSSCH